MRPSPRAILCAFALFPMAVLEGQVPCSPLSFGSIEQDPLTIDGDIALPADCTLDFGDRQIILAGTLRAIGLTIVAGEITTAPQSRIEGGQSITTLVLRAGRLHAGTANIGGLLRNVGLHGGGVVVEAIGGVLVRGTASIDASAESPSGNGGFIAIEAKGEVVLEPGRGLLAARAGEIAGLGGEVSIVSTASSVVLDDVTVRGGFESPGAVVVSAARNLTVAGAIRAAGSCAAGTCSRSGVVRLTAGGLLEVLAPIDARGGAGGAFVGDGNGGAVILDASGDLRVAAEVNLSGDAASRGGSFAARCDGLFTLDRAAVDARGSFPDADGGDIRIAPEGDAVIEGPLHASGGADAQAGRIEVIAGEDLFISGPLDAWGNWPTGGIALTAVNGAVQIASRLDASGKGPYGTAGGIQVLAVTGILLKAAVLDARGAGADGLGGRIVLDSFLAMESTAGSQLLASGDAAGDLLGAGGLIEISGCEVILDGAALASGEEGGEVQITASGPLALSGTFHATDGGSIELRHPGELPPTLGGTDFDPLPAILPSDLRGPCFLPPPCDPVEGLACLVSGRDVGLAWVPTLGHARVQVLRDGAPIAVVNGFAATYTDPGAPLGAHSYSLKGICLQGESAEVSCRIEVGEERGFIRGECNISAGLDISDPVYLLGFLFQGNERPRCEKACDSNDDGEVDISDAIQLLGFLFTGGRPPAAPHAACGADPTPDRLPCPASSSCP